MLLNSAATLPSVSSVMAVASKNTRCNTVIKHGNALIKLLIAAEELLTSYRLI